MNKFLIIMTAIFFVLMIAVNSVIFKFVLSGPALVNTCIVSWIIVGILSLVIAARYSHLNRTNNGTNKEDYIIRIWSVLIVMVLFWFGLSLVGGIVTFAVVTFMKNGFGTVFLNGAIIPILMLAVYLLGVYKNFIKLGFQDAQEQRFNLNLKILTLLLLLMFVMPMAIFGNAYSTYYPQTGFLVDFRSIFSFNIDLTLVDDPILPETVTKANMVFVMAKALFVLAAEMAVAVFAYVRGKAVFIKQHIRQGDDYQTDEKFAFRKNTILKTFEPSRY